MNTGLIVIRSGMPLALGGSARAAGKGTDHYLADPPGAGVTEDVMRIRFSPFNVWYEVNSWWEGRFLEQTTRGAFAKTMAERGAQVKCLLNHGMEFDIGDKPLGVPVRLAEEPDSAVMECACLDTSYMRDQVMPGVQAGAYGSSFMFQVLSEEWNREPEASDTNPEALPERTITQVRLYEAGPVTWPANPAATAEMNSTEQFMSALRSRNPARYDELDRKFAGFRAEHHLTGTGRPAAIDSPADQPVPTSAPADRHTGMGPAARQRALRLKELARTRV